MIENNQIEYYICKVQRLLDMESIYQKEIFDLAKNQTNKLFFNSSPEHAAIVHQAIMTYAKQYVYIFSSAMCSEVSNNKDYCDLVERFLQSSNQHIIKIILTDYNKDGEKLPIFRILRKYPQQAVIRKFDGKAMLNEKEAHFTVSDDITYRIETDIVNKMAFGNFNAPKQAMVLKSAFEKIFNEASTCLIV